MEALDAMKATRDRSLSRIGFDRALFLGILGSYLEMMNRGKSGGYSKRSILIAKMRPGVDPLRKTNTKH